MFSNTVDTIVMMILLLLLLGCSCMNDFGPGQFGQCDESMDSEKIEEVALFAVGQMNEIGIDEFKLVDIESCQEQVVYGINWKLEIGTESEEGRKFHHLVTVFESLLGDFYLTSFEVRDGSGGWESCEDRVQNLEKDMLLTLSKVLVKINEMSNAEYYIQIVQVVSCEEQVVAGINYRLVLELGGSPDGSTETKTFDVYKDLEGIVDVKME